VISAENRKIFPPRVFCASTGAVPAGIEHRRWDHKTRMMELPGRERSLTISSAVRIHCTNVIVGRTNDGQTDTGRQQRPRLRMASRVKEISENVANLTKAGYKVCPHDFAHL